MTASLQTDVPLSALTTLGVGGPARGLGFASDHPALLDCLERADADDAPLLVLGGGSNLLVADGGFDGHVLRLTDTAITVVASEPARVRVRVGAGRDWDPIKRESKQIRDEFQRLDRAVAQQHVDPAGRGPGAVEDGAVAQEGGHGRSLSREGAVRTTAYGSYSRYPNASSRCRKASSPPSTAARSRPP